MTNNRLFILDTNTGEKFLLATSRFDGWSVSEPGATGDALDEWLSVRDLEAAKDKVAGRTALLLICESDPDYETTIDTARESGKTFSYD